MEVIAKEGVWKATMCIGLGSKTNEVEPPDISGDYPQNQSLAKNKLATKLLKNQCLLMPRQSQ